jgi:hypothetical protein
LDPVYGHALLKLLGARSFSGGLGGTDGCVAIVPRALAPLAPKFIDELWVVECRVGELNEWLSALDVQLRAELERFEIARLATVPPHPHPSTYDLMDLAPHALPERSGAPSIVLSLRDDRRWGAQEDNVAQLLAALAEVFPRVGVAAVGPGTPGGLPDQVLDMRDPSPSAERESRWVSLMRGADLAVGVHGSNLLLPSGLAAATVEIVPRSRYPNLFQATLMAEHDPLLALDRHRVVYADEDMSDISGSRVALVAIPLLQGMTRFAQLMTGSAAGVGVEPLIRLDPGAPPPTPPPVARSQIDRVKAMIAGLLDRLGRRSDSDGTTEREFEAALLAGLEGRLVEVLDLNDARNGPGDARRKVEAAWEAGNSVHRLDKALTAIRVAGPLMHPVRAVALRDDSSE